MTKKQIIIDAAIELFAAKGIEATSVQQITEHCGISKGAFYLSFKSKDELIIAIIEYFMSNIIKNVDQSVSETMKRTDKLLVYFVKTFTILSEYTGFAEILMRERSTTISEKLIEKVQFFVEMSNANLTKLLFDVFGEQIEGKQYDLVVVVNGMIQSYAHMLFENKQHVDIQKLAETLVEKTTILAMNSQLVFLKKPINHPHASEPVFPVEEIIEGLQQACAYSSNKIEKESVQLLIEELQSEMTRAPIVLGLVSNIEKNDKFDWYCYLLRKQFQ
ncbi:TetR family transcriptional regulator [Solibacillus sp. R5-41]|uniref:TetR/AcrR family transcriptional regulator n=1 Tax=Solibacillus sp. R5-41 TaxID=2048654 RepID=UPI000C124FFF|nr:TetR/AcrR family transcriptional regulator [Solibacillus sp. R5-41]ATP40397.1 TetR family transcriptional regulator [Solibacillus sp. R5-41]